MPTPSPSTKPDADATPLDALWQARAVMWVVLAGEGLALVLALAPGVVGDRWIYFALTSVVTQWVSLLALSALYLLRQPLGRLRPQNVAYVALGLLLLSTWLVTGVAWLLLRDLWASGGGDWQLHFLRFGGIALAVGLLALAAFQNHWRARRLAVMAKQSELDALQARIRPHFLFNTLNTGAALVHARPGEAERLLLDLADLFRAALSGPRDIPLADELALARRYLEIESLRFAGRLQLRWVLPESIPAVRVPALSIQPLVENAIRHGIEPLAEGGAVDIVVRVEGDRVRIEVANDLPKSASKASVGHRVGLASARERIEALSLGRGRLETAVVDGRHVATILMPLDAAGYSPTTR
jgi:two-component system sensor histidine kinase AlgZ